MIHPHLTVLVVTAEMVVADLTRPDSLAAAVDGVDAIVFTHGSDGGGKAGAERIDYGGVRNVLAALGGRSVRIALMTAIGVTNRDGEIARRQIAAVLVASLTSDGAVRKSFELVATQGPAQDDLNAEFARLDADPPDALDAVRDLPNMPLQDEPQRVRHDLEPVSRQR